MNQAGYKPETNVKVNKNEYVRKEIQTWCPMNQHMYIKTIIATTMLIVINAQMKKMHSNANLQKRTFARFPPVDRRRGGDCVRRGHSQTL